MGLHCSQVLNQGRITGAVHAGQAALQAHMEMLFNDTTLLVAEIENWIMQFHSVNYFNDVFNISALKKNVITTVNMDP